MKASNIILMSIVGSITLLITVGAFQIRFGDHEKIKEEFETKNLEISAFKYLIIKNVSYPLNITMEEKSAFEFMVKNNKQAPEIDYHHQGDTLIIQNFGWKDEYLHDVSVLLKIPEEVEWVKADNSSLNFKNYSNEELTLDLDKTSVSIDNNHQLKNLTLLAKNDSKINAYNSNLDTLTMSFDKSYITIHGLVGKLKGSIKNNSTVSVKGINDFDFSKDNSSKLHHWN